MFSIIIFDNKTKNINFKEKKLDKTMFIPEDIILMNEVIDQYRNKQPFELVNKTHSEAPWKNSVQNQIITKESIKQYYQKNENKILSE